MHAYQEQPTIFQNKQRVLLRDTVKDKLPRCPKNIGLGFKTPKEVIEGTSIAKKCPFTGNVSIRGRVLSGVVTKMKMQRTIVILRDHLHYIQKHNRFEKRQKNICAPCFCLSFPFCCEEGAPAPAPPRKAGRGKQLTLHDLCPPRDVQIGDIVTVDECPQQADDVQ